MRVFVPGRYLLLLLAFGLFSGFVVFEEKFDSDEEYFLPSDVWVGAYCSDAWRTDLSGGITPRLDDGCANCGCNTAVYSSGGNACGQSDPFDNHIKAGNQLWQNYIYTVKIRNDDDDTFGVVFRYIRSNQFYLFIVSGDQVPDLSTGCSGTKPGGQFIRVGPDGQTKTFKHDSTLRFTPGKVHLVRVTANGTNIRIEFDKNANGFFEADEIFFDGQDSDGNAILRGRVGLYSFENGAEEYGEPTGCGTGGCYFDDVSVDLLSPNNDNCGEVPAEGMCEGNTLKYCGGDGKLVSQSCGFTACCRYSPADLRYDCISGLTCLSCEDDCTQGSKGCSANLTHSWSCVAAGDDDDCLEPKYTACPSGVQCDPATGECAGNPCVPSCTGKECGPDGCGGICGACGEGYICEVGGQCKPDGECTPTCDGAVCGGDGCGGSCGECGEGKECMNGACYGQVGATCTQSTQCLTGLCLPLGQDSLCTLACSADSACPEGWECINWLMGQPAKVCAPKTNRTIDNCPDTAECVGLCGGNVACITTCYMAATDGAQADYALLFQCMTTKCTYCTDDACLGQCSMTTCFQDFANCFPGQLNCQESLECMQECPSAQEECSSDCYSDAMPGAKKLLVDLFACIEDECEDSSDPSCAGNSISAGACKPLFEQCLGGCVAFCEGYECGPDGCGGNCGSCGAGEQCKSGACVVVCVPTCEGKSCGSDGCGGQCGTCGEGFVCVDGECNDAGECKPRDELRCVGSDLYWFDSCGKKGTLAKSCTYGCQDGDCMGQNPIDNDISEVDVEGDAAGGEEDLGPVEFGGGGAKSGGCAVQNLATGWSAASLLALALALLGLARLFCRRSVP